MCGGPSMLGVERFGLLGVDVGNFGVVSPIPRDQMRVCLCICVS